MKTLSKQAKNTLRQDRNAVLVLKGTKKDVWEICLAFQKPEIGELTLEEFKDIVQAGNNCRGWEQAINNFLGTEQCTK